MNVLIACIVAFGVAILGMAVGVIFSDRRIKGSCGGLSGLQDAVGNPICDGCSEPLDCDTLEQNAPPNPAAD